MVTLQDPPETFGVLGAFSRNLSLLGKMWDAAAIENVGNSKSITEKKKTKL